ncbi:sigma-70 region 4 domain-containing protein [Sphaerotilus sp.]|uniref:sigma-70 region 4 domain-containing protein n=1 Tax=Sphaerotilus sp. TaxID=2093942 RepID=UPI00286E3A18|nr:sigma-70 region 4 domain-containing protein [Sphaerotilus sp.]
MKPTDPATVARAIALRRTHSLRQIAEELGVSLGTVKTWMSRAGVKLGNNEALRTLMSLPPITTSEGTAVVVAPELPAQEAVTGIKDVDAMLWLRAVIATEHPDHIAKALEAVKRVKTKPKDLETAYMMWLRSRQGDMAAIFGSMGFADLEGAARSATERAATKAEALARFGTAEALLADTDGERFCIEACHGLKWHTEAPHYGGFDPAEAATRFKARPEYLPHTLDDCLFELAHWNDLCRLRRPFDVADQQVEVNARDDFLFGELAHIRPRTKAEAIDVLRYLAEDGGDRMDRRETPAILENLVGTP